MSHISALLGFVGAQNKTATEKPKSEIEYELNL